MRVYRADLRVANDRKLAQFLQRVRDAGILVAHGSKGGSHCCGRDLEWFKARAKGGHLWLHACLCANALAPALAGGELAVYAFTTTILVGEKAQGELAYVDAALKDAPRHATHAQVALDVRNRWHDAASKALDASQVLSAAVLTHLELSLRSFGSE